MLKDHSIKKKMIKNQIIFEYVIKDQLIVYTTPFIFSYFLVRKFPKFNKGKNLFNI